MIYSLSSPSEDLPCDEYLTFPSVSSTAPLYQITDSSPDDLNDFEDLKQQATFDCQSNHWMSDHFDQEWMSQPGGFDFRFPATTDQYSSGAPHDDFSQLYGESAFAQQFPANFAQPASQQSAGSHRRLQSTSSVASAADSPYNHNSPLAYPQYPSPSAHLFGFPNPQNQGLGYDTWTPVSGVQHLPTPTGTPTSEKHHPPVQSNSRRTQPSINQQAAWARAHNSVRSALNQQWKPSTYSPSHLQTPTTFADMPRTPQTANGDEHDTQQYGAVTTTVPKFDRTVSDAQADELYNPSSFGQVSTTVPRKQSLNTTSLQPPQPQMLQERLQAANKARSSSPSSPGAPGGYISPWRNSPYGDFTTHGVMQTSSRASRYKERQKQQEPEEPKTVSPKDAFPEQPMSKEDEQYESLFPTSSGQNLQYAPHNANLSSQSSVTAFSTPAPNYWNYATSLPTQQNFPRIKHEGSMSQEEQQYGPIYANGTATAGNYLPPNLTSMETTKSESSEPIESSQESTPQRPSDTSAGRNRYTCPYHDDQGEACQQTFEDPLKLQTHKRTHRPTGQKREGDQSPASKMSQAGPHKCTRINPSTGKPCDTIFSRPYDLTRHEDTIHGEKKKLRCEYCPDEKLFSRNDALTRHMRVVHPDRKQSAGKRGRKV